MSDFNELAERFEAASGAGRELLCAAFKAAFPKVAADGTAYDRFCAMLDVGAPESAAMTLIPKGWEYTMMNGNGYPEVTLTNHQIQRTAWSSGNTLTCAIAAAALRARSTMDNNP